MPESAQRLALLIGAPWRGEAAMHGDVQAFYDALSAVAYRPMICSCWKAGWIES